MRFFHKPVMTESEQNVKSIEAIPTRLLPKGQLRENLMAWAAAGLDVYAYTPAQHPDTPENERRWNLWIETQRWDVASYVEIFGQSEK